MTPHIKTILLSNAPLKIFSLILGYTCWLILGHAITTTTWLTVPVSFYGADKHTTVKAPETIDVQLRAKRAVLQDLDPEQLAVHINAAQLAEGKNNVAITNETLFLPETINLVHYSPSNFMIECISS